MNNLTKKQCTPQRRNDATKRKEPKNKIMYVSSYYFWCQSKFIFLNFVAEYPL